MNCSNFTRDELLGKKTVHQASPDERTRRLNHETTVASFNFYAVKHRRSRACHVRSRGSRCARQDGDKGNENGRRGLALTFSSPALSRFV
jgi:hypothetical protein